MITIIVLLILAGISVQMLTGNNGVLQRAAEAKENTEQSQKEEQRRLASMEAAINTTETTFQGVKIPAGFAPTRIEGESTVEKGLVITDSKGNEFVWVEVPKTVTASVTEDNDIYDALRDYCNDVIAKTGTDYKTSTNGYTDTWYSGCGLEQDEYNTAKSKMLNSIKANGGFYIGKYETGIDDSSIAEDATTTAGLITSSGDTTQTAVIKQNKEPYTYVTCSQAQNLAEGFATDGKTASLLFGIQWDLVLKFIKVKESLPDNTILTSNSTD